jgi:hypothetical protein
MFFEKEFYMEIQELDNNFINYLPKDGSAIGNMTLIAELRKKYKDLTDDDYWKVRNNLIDSGKISKAMGKGGSVYLLEISPQENKKDEAKKARMKESELYDPFMKAIKEFWVKDNDIDDYLIANNANQSKKKTGGRWTRPDITLISMKNYQFVFGKIMEVITFEIKPEDNFGVESVFQTASQSVFAHKSFLCIHLTTGKPETEEFDRITRQCELFGVGLIVFENPNDWNTYETIVDPKRREPDPYEVNSFIKQQLPDKIKEELSKKLK